MYMSDRLIAAATLYHKEAGKYLRGRAYLAACVMQGAALEASLQAMCFIFPEAVKKTTVYQKKKKRGFQRKRNRALDFKYVELINIAAELSWFPPKKMVVWGRRTNLAGFVHELRKLRNYVHAGVLAPKDNPVKFTKGVFNAVFEIFDVANSWLLHRVRQSLVKRMEREDKVKAKLGQFSKSSL
jgi:hypothetical protein